MENQNNTFALLIGVGGDLPYSVKDAKNLYASFTDKNLIGYPKENVIMLTGKKASHDGILKAFDELKELTNEDSTIILYYSGHGGQDRKEHNFFLQPNDMTQENYKSTRITNATLADKISALPSSRLVLFLDCCHAEGMIQSGIEGLSGMAKKLKEDHDIWVMVSCQDDQESYGARGQSFFTRSLLNVLSGKHKRPFTDTEVSMMDVVEHIFEDVPKIASGYKDKFGKPCVQTPFFQAKMSENLILSYFPQNRQNNQAVINELEPKIKDLDEESFIKLIKAMETEGRADDAINAMKKNKRTKADPDLMETLGDLYRHQYVKNKLQKVGNMALDCYQKAYNLAVSTEDEEQIFTNAVKIAFMYAKMDLNKRIMREHATIALDAAEKYFLESSSKYATMAEACIYLGKIDDAKIHYQELAEKAGIRLRMQYYEQGVTVYNILFKPENQKDPFIVFMEETLLT